MADVFLSYSKARRDIAVELARVLADGGISVWWDTELLDEDFSEEIDTQLKSSVAIIVLWTKQSIKSQWVKSEAQYGFRKKKLINVHVEDIDPEEDIPFPFHRYNSLPLKDVDKVVTAVRRRLQGLPMQEVGSRTVPEVATDNLTHRAPQPGRVFKDFEYSPSMVIVPSGSYHMGCGDKEAGGRRDERPVHLVRIGKPFAVAQYPVTFLEWEEARRNGFDVPELNGIPNAPVTNVTWNGASRYAQWLRGKSGRAYRLLSEAEWEYVCRADTATAYSVGTILNQLNAKYNINYDAGVSARSTAVSDAPITVGSYRSNAFKVYDMHGNVWEWVEDDYHFSYAGAPVDGSAWLDNPRTDHRVIRGGCFASGARQLRSSRRGRCTLLPREPGKIGFRVACSL